MIIGILLRISVQLQNNEACTALVDHDRGSRVQGNLDE